MADGRAPMGIPHAVEDSVCLGRSVGMAFKDVPTTKIASQVMELGSLSTTSWYKLPGAFMTSNPNFLGLQCVISASLPYCTDIDECQDARPAFNKAAHCGDHAVVFWFLTGIAAICSGLREHHWEFLLHLPWRISEPLHDVWLLGYWRVSEYILIDCFAARIINSNVKAHVRQQ